MSKGKRSNLELLDERPPQKEAEQFDLADIAPREPAKPPLANSELLKEPAGKIATGERNSKGNRSGSLVIPKRLLRRLQEVGIRCFRQVETHGRSDGQFVVRGIESGGAVTNAGHYVSFCDEVGQSVPGYCFYDGGIGVNSRHAIVVAPVLIKIEMLREGHVYHLLITKHTPDPSMKGAALQRSHVENIFYGRDGYLEWDLVKRDADKRGRVVPRFFTPAGEEIPIPGEWMAAVRAITASLSCLNCRHAHYVGSSQEVVT